MDGENEVEGRHAADSLLPSVNILPRYRPYTENADIYIICFKVLKANNLLWRWSRLVAYSDCSALLDYWSVFIRVNARRWRSYLRRYRYLVTVVTSSRNTGTICMTICIRLNRSCLLTQSSVHLSSISCRYCRSQLRCFVIWTCTRKYWQEAAVLQRNRAMFIILRIYIMSQKHPAFGLL